MLHTHIILLSLIFWQFNVVTCCTTTLNKPNQTKKKKKNIKDPFSSLSSHHVIDDEVFGYSENTFFCQNHHSHNLLFNPSYLPLHSLFIFNHHHLFPHLLLSFNLSRGSTTTTTTTATSSSSSSYSTNSKTLPYTTLTPTRKNWSNR